MSRGGGGAGDVGEGPTTLRRLRRYPSLKQLSHYGGAAARVPPPPEERSGRPRAWGVAASGGPAACVHAAGGGASAEEGCRQRSARGRAGGCLRAFGRIIIEA